MYYIVFRTRELTSTNTHFSHAFRFQQHSFKKLMLSGPFCRSIVKGSIRATKSNSFPRKNLIWGETLSVTITVSFRVVNDLRRDLASTRACQAFVSLRANVTHDCSRIFNLLHENCVTKYFRKHFQMQRGLIFLNII
jgi:hypothetical protein